jgi:hypothetical protein
MIKRWRTLVTTSIKTTCLTANQKKLLWIDCRNLCKPNLVYLRPPAASGLPRATARSCIRETHIELKITTEVHGVFYMQKWTT